MKSQINESQKKPNSEESSPANLQYTAKTLLFFSLPVFVLIIAIPIIPYYRNFPSEFSRKQEVWGQFGDYIGGTLNPIIGIIGTIAILVSLHQSRESLNNSTRALEAELADQKKREQDDQYRRRHELTINLYLVWISAEMQNLRTLLWKEVNWELRVGDNAMVDISFLRSGSAQQQTIFYSFGTITHFVHDLNSMMANELVDDKLVLALLGRSLKQWKSLYENIRFHSDSPTQSEMEEHLWHHFAWTGRLGTSLDNLPS